MAFDMHQQLYPDSTFILKQSLHKHGHVGVLRLRAVAHQKQFRLAVPRFDLSYVSAPQDINAVEEAKKNLAARGDPMPEGYCQVVLMRPAREA